MTCCSHPQKSQLRGSVVSCWRGMVPLETLTWITWLVPHWPQNMCLISLIFEFGTQLCSTQSLLRHRASLYQAVPQRRQCKDFSSRPRVREAPPKDQWPWSRTELLLEGLGPETPAITLFISFHPFSLSVILCISATCSATSSKSGKVQP